MTTMIVGDFDQFLLGVHVSELSMMHVSPHLHQQLLGVGDIRWLKLWKRGLPRALPNAHKLAVWLKLL